MTEYYTSCTKCADSAVEEWGQFVNVSEGAIGAVATCSRHQRSWLVMADHAPQSDPRKDNKDNTD